jgi:hypothetical protein
MGNKIVIDNIPPARFARLKKLAEERLGISLANLARRRLKIPDAVRGNQGANKGKKIKQKFGKKRKPKA